MASRFIIIIIIFIMMMVERLTGLPSSHPLHSAVDRINESGPYIGVVMSYKAEAEALHSSGHFVVRSQLDLYGRRFHIGSIHGVDVICVLSGQRRLNAGTTVQVLLDVFNVWGIVHYGTAGSSNNSLSFGDVSVPKFVAFTGSWTWTKFGSKEGELPELSFGAYNMPTGGKNQLSVVEFKPEEFYSVGKPMEEVFWMQVNQEWYQVAEQLKVELQRCANESYCLPDTPRVVSGLKASTADMFIDNAAYREFLFKEFGVSTVDEESAAVVMVSKLHNQTTLKGKLALFTYILCNQMCSPTYFDSHIPGRACDCVSRGVRFGRRRSNVVLDKSHGSCLCEFSQSRP